MSKPLISIVIVDFKKGPQVVENIESLLQQKGINLEIFIADNSLDSQNASYLKPLEKKYKNVRVTINKKNTGYTKANNDAAKDITGKYVCFVNPDITWPETSTLCDMVSYIEKNKNVGMVGPKQITPDGSMEHTARAFPNLGLQFARRTWLRYLPFVKKNIAKDEYQALDYSKPQKVDWLQSSCVLLPTKLWKKLKGFDEDFFLFLADTDICWRSWQQGQEVVLYPKAKVHADGVRSSEGGFLDIFKNWIVRQHIKDAYTFYLKHRRQSNPRG